MVLAAGLGTRLLPLTADRPKALVTLGGRTLLEITLARLRAFGVREAIVNAHHCAGQIVDYLRANGNFGMRIEISREESLLDTGGGLKQAGWFFLPPDSATPSSPGQESHPAETSRLVTGHDLSRAQSAAPKNEGALAPAVHPAEPFLVHNVDVISTIDLARMVEAHRESGALATLAVKERETSRHLLFDERGLCGRRAGKDAEPEMARPSPHWQPLAFCGIHVISPRLLSLMRGQGAFSIIGAYLDLAAQGERIAPFRADAYAWRDLGTPESLADAEREVASGRFA